MFKNILLTFCFIFLFTAYISTADEVAFKHTVIDNQQPRNPYTKILADIDKDGQLDIVIGGSAGPLVWYAYPEWKKYKIADGGYATVDGEAADMDGDGDMDIVMGGILWYENPLPSGDPSKGAWKAHRVADHRTHDIEVADLDSDGDQDIVTRDQSEFGARTGNKIHIWYQEGSDKWREHVIECPHGEGLTLHDLDGDGDADILISGIWYENDGTEWKSHKYADSYANASVEVGDLNGDNLPDIVITPAELKGQRGNISWFEAPANTRQDGWKEHIVEKNVEAVYHSLELADINNDGQLDIITAEMHQGDDPDEVMVYYNENDGQSWKKQVLSTKGSHDVITGDIGNDGDIDIVGANHAGDQAPVELWENLLQE